MSEFFHCRFLEETLLGRCLIFYIHLSLMVIKTIEANSLKGGSRYPILATRESEEIFFLKVPSQTSDPSEPASASHAPFFLLMLTSLFSKIIYPSWSTESQNCLYFAPMIKKIYEKNNFAFPFHRRIFLSKCPQSNVVGYLA